MALDLGQLAKKLLVNPIVAAGRAIGRDYKATVYGPDWEERRAARKVNAELTRQKIEAEIRRSNASADADVENSRYAAALRGADLESKQLQSAGLKAAAAAAGMSVEDFVGKQIIDKGIREDQVASDMSEVRKALANLNTTRAEHAGDAKPQTPGQFFMLVDPNTNQPTFFAPRSGATVQPPAGLGKPLTQEEKNVRASTDDLSRALDDAEALASDPELKNENAGLGATGMLGGLATEARVRTGNTTPKLNALRVRLSKLKRQLYNISGKQINEAELPRLLETIPNLDSPPDLLAEQFKEFRSELEAAKSRFKIGPRTTKPGGAAAPAPSRFKIEVEQ